MADSSIFKGSVTDRFAIETPISDAMGMRVADPGAVDWREYDAALGRDIRKGDSTFAGWMMGLERKLDAARLFASNGNIPAAMAIDEEIQKFTNANADTIIAFRNQSGVQPGSLAERMRDLSVRLYDGAYLQDKVTYGGREYTYGTLLRSAEGKAAVEQATGDTLRGLGFSGDVAKLLVSGTSDTMSAFAEEVRPKDPGTGRADPGDVARYVAFSDTTARNCMKLLTDNDLKVTALNRGAIPPDDSRAVRTGMANEVAANWKDYFSVFGGATEDFVSRSLSSFRDSGGHRMMPGMRDYALRLAQRDPSLKGKALVEETFRQYDDWIASVTKTRTPPARGQKPDPDDIGLNEQNAALAGAIGALSRMDKDFDLRSPESRANASELGDIVAKMKVSGVNLMALARRNGVDINTDMAMHVLGAASPGSAVANVKAFFEDEKRYTGGEDFASAVYGATHSASDYWASLSRQNGGASTCAGADALLVGVNRARRQSLLPVMFERGLSHRDAMAVVRRDQTLVEGYAKRMADAFDRALPGVGSREAAAALTRYMIDHEADAQGGGVNVQRLITDMSEGKIKGARLSSAAVDSLRGWVSANVKDAPLFGDYVTQVQQKLTGFGVSPYYAAMLASQASARASRLKAEHKDWTIPFRTFLGDFTRVPQQQFDGRKLVATQMVFGHANKLNQDINLRGQNVHMTPGMYNADPLMFEAFFRDVEAEGKELDRQRLLALRQLIKEDPAAYAQDQP